jgi:hypothetical protein
VRSNANKTKLESFLEALGNKARGSGRIYLTGGASALLIGWRQSTIDVDIKADPEPAGLFEALAELKDKLDLNIELASPDMFIPELPGWRDRSQFIARFGSIDFYHFDFYSQVLAKLERGHDRDILDVSEIKRLELVSCEILMELFREIQPLIKRFPSIEGGVFEQRVLEYCSEL